LTTASTTGVQFPAEAVVELFSFPSCPDSASFPMDTSSSYPGSKAAEAWSYTSTSPVRLHDVVLS